MGCFGRYGDTRCFSCGQAITINDGQATELPPTETCAECQTPLTKGQYFCHKCGLLHAKPLPVEVSGHDTWIDAKSNAEGMDDVTWLAIPGLGLLVRAVLDVKFQLGFLPNFAIVTVRRRGFI